ncbi:MAG TPA: HEAT repeat domain-containing protein [Ktedonobacteraceae bacterium]|nr:HEAT repeat domain-containing protein [Ktedonobacteraceae bacterium]
MSDTSLEQTETTDPTGAGTAEPGEVRLGEKTTTTPVETMAASAELEAKIVTPRQATNRTGTVEHLAARRPVTPIDINSMEVKERLSDLRTNITRVMTDFRWGNCSLEEATEQIISLLNVGSIYQWAPVLIPFILEIDRAGDFIPAWLNVIEQGDPPDLPLDSDPAETTVGRARRIAILMLGNYKTVAYTGESLPLGFSKQNKSKQNLKSTAKIQDLAQFLGKLSLDPNTSSYATQSLAKQATTTALQALISALKDAEGWAKVDIVEACLSLEQPRFYEIVLASGLDRVAGLESYVAVPIYRSIPLEGYLRGGNTVTPALPRLSQQAALIFGQVLQESMKFNAGAEKDSLPIVFERNFAPLASALFESARVTPCWQNVLAIHRLATLLGHYWREISHGSVQDVRILEPVYACLPMMNDVERWMNGPGRDVLLEALSSSEEEAFLPTVKVLGEMREPRAFSILVSRLGMITSISNREEAIQLVHICDTLGRLNDRRAVQPMLQLVGRTLDVAGRAARPKRRDNLPSEDGDIPGSIVYAAVLRAFGQLTDRGTLDFVLRAANDFDPFVRVEVLEALKQIDPVSDDARSRITAREALNDPRDSVVRIACRVVTQYRDTSAFPVLQRLTETRPEVAAAAYDALKQLGQ